MRAKTLLAVLLGAMALGPGCSASIPPPNSEWAAAEVDVGRAQTGGALDVPEAKLHLQLAQEDLQKSKTLMNDDNAHAARLCAVASSEAQLALSLAMQAKAQDWARAAQAELQKGSDK